MGTHLDEVPHADAPVLGAADDKRVIVGEAAIELVLAVLMAAIPGSSAV